MIAVGALAAVGRVEGWHAWLALELTPGLLLGVWLSFRLAPVLDRRWLRPPVLAFAAISGVVIVIRGLI